MRKVIGSLMAAGAIAAVAVAPAAAELDFCMVDPAVNVDGSVIQVGLYTHNLDLAVGGVPANTPIVVTLVGKDGGTLSTDAADWQQHGHTTLVSTFNALPGGDKAKKEKVEIDALVPSPLLNDSFFIKVTLPDGAQKTVSGKVNTLIRMTVEVPVEG